MILEKILESVSGLSAFAMYFSVSICLLLLFAVIYAKITPYREFALISEGNIAASCSMSGALLGFALPLASAVIHSVGMIDMVIWGAIALIIQALTFLAVKIIFPHIVVDIPAGKTSNGIFLGMVSLVAGILNAACMTY